jgi:co-chaperonin GroES (HSP10)
MTDIQPKSRMRMQTQGDIQVDASRLPQPTGYKLLCALPNIEETSAGGIIMTNETLTAERTASQVLEVIAMGPQAYTDKDRYPEPWCAVGDHILVRPFAGVRVMIDGKEFRVLNEDMVEATLPEPDSVTSL